MQPLIGSSFHTRRLEIFRTIGLDFFVQSLLTHALHSRRLPAGDEVSQLKTQERHKGEFAQTEHSAKPASEKLLGFRKAFPERRTGKKDVYSLHLHSFIC